MDDFHLFLLGFLAPMGLVIAVILWEHHRNQGGGGRREPAYEVNQAEIESRIREIYQKAEMLDKLYVIAKSHTDDADISELVNKQVSIIHYLMDYSDKYEAQLLKLEWQKIRSGSMSLPAIDAFDELQALLLGRYNDIRALSKATNHAMLDAQYESLRSAIEGNIKSALIQQTRSIIANESPLQQRFGLVEPEALHGNSSSVILEIDALNKEYDRFIAEMDLS